MVFIAVYSIPTFDAVTNIVGIGGIVIGIVPLLLGGALRARRASVR